MIRALGTLLIPFSCLCAAPQIMVVGTNEIDFGTYPAKEVKQAQFAIKNSGDSELKISGLRLTCDCSTVDIATKNLAPGVTAKLSLKVNGNSLDSEFNRKIYVLSNDPKNSCLELIFRGTARPICEVSPDKEVYLGTLAADGTLQYSFKLKATETGVVPGTPIVKADFPVKAVIVKISEQELSLDITSSNLKTAPSRFTLEVAMPINQPSGWAPLKMTLAGRIKAK